MCKLARMCAMLLSPQTARLWLTNLDEIIGAVCALLTRNLIPPVPTLHTPLNLSTIYAIYEIYSLVKIKEKEIDE